MLATKHGDVMSHKFAECFVVGLRILRQSIPTLFVCTRCRCKFMTCISQTDHGLYIQWYPAISWELKGQDRMILKKCSDTPRASLQMAPLGSIDTSISSSQGQIGMTHHVLSHVRSLLSFTIPVTTVSVLECFIRAEHSCCQACTRFQAPEVLKRLLRPSAHAASPKLVACPTWWKLVKLIWFDLIYNRTLSQISFAKDVYNVI